MTTYVYDGSFGGFLSSVFESFERKEFAVRLVAQNLYAPLIFEEPNIIETNVQKSKRVMDGLSKKVGYEKAKDFFRIFLSEDVVVIQYAFDLIQQIFNLDNTILENFGDEKVLYFAQTLKKVSRERHRMKAFIRFEKSSDGMFFCVIAPDFNVLPLIVDFFQKRYADQAWLIYDEKRNYGMHYDKISVNEVQLMEQKSSSPSLQKDVVALDVEEQKFQQLWKSYFKSTNIEARRNMKLHLRHVPKRYWRYLTEKNVLNQ